MTTTDKAQCCAPDMCPTCTDEGGHVTHRCEMRYCNVPANHHDSAEWTGYACHMHLDALIWVESVRRDNASGRFARCG